MGGLWLFLNLIWAETILRSFLEVSVTLAGGLVIKEGVGRMDSHCGLGLDTPWFNGKLL